MLRAIVHLDADAFFAAVEQAADPRLRGQPVAVGGERRGIIASASYEARRFGIYTPMPTSRARKLCPRLILLPGDFEKYERFSRWMFSYAYDFTPEVEITSIDEGYFDLSGARQPALAIARTIRQAIHQALKLSVSEGIGSNKLVSQIASKLHKPAAFVNVPPGEEIPFLHPLPNRWLPGVGPKTGARLDAAGLARIHQVAATPTDCLSLIVGRAAPQLKQFADGLDDRPVVPVSAPAQSYSHQETFAEDQTDEEFLEATLRRMADRLMAKVREDGKSIRTLTVKVRYNDMAEDQCGESLAEPTDLETDLYPRLRPLLRRAWKRRVSLRMVSLKFANVYAGFFRDELPLTVAEQQHEARRRLATIIDELRRAHGREVVMRGHDLLLRQARAGPPPSASAGLPANSSPRGRSRVMSSRRVLPAAPLAVHSHYSFLDSTLSIPAIIELARRHELPAVALADQANLHGAVEFALAARQAGLRPVLGAEIRWNNCPLWLYVENLTGYRNLCRLLTEYGRRPGLPGQEGETPEAEVVSQKSHERKPVPAPQGWQTIRDLQGWDTTGLLAVATDTALAGLFPGRFYLAVCSPKALSGWSGVERFPRVAMPPVHYAAPPDRWKYDVVQSIRTRTLLRQQHPDKRLEGDYHFPAPAEMREWFKEHPELLEHARELAERCEFDFNLGRLQFPQFTPPDGSPPPEFLRRLVREGLRRRYPDRYRQLQPQVEEELNIIREVGYEEYFLVVWDILRECRWRGIDWITRGSAADSLVCYCLGISEVCPIRFQLYFRRFLNKERMALNKLPDIDVDFPHDRKDDVIDLLFEKYGPAHAAVVGGFSTFQARGAVGDVAKVLGVSEFHIRRFTENFPWTGAKGLAGLLQRSPECRDLPLAEEPYKSALALAEFLDGFPRYPKMHPCGLVLSRDPMTHLVPCFTSRKGYPTTHFDMDAVEAIGLVKLDILAQGGLAVMRDVQAMLAQRDVALDLNSLTVIQPAAVVSAKTDDEFIPRPACCTPAYDDPEVWEMLASGGGRGVHHIESPAMVSLCCQANVREIDGLIAIVSVIRPGAANEQKKLKFTRRYQGLEPITYPDPSLEAALKSTFGLVVYEEHILQICEAFAGLDPGRADVLRRALGKEKQEIVAQIQEEFFAAAHRRGQTEAKIAEVWDLVRGFSGYAFCKAHSTAYGVEAYQSAWLKHYFPAEFMAAVLTNGKGFYQPLVYVLECHRLGIGFLPPWVNEPGPGFTVINARPRTEPFPSVHQGQAQGHFFIRVPVSSIRGLTDRTKERVLIERERGEFSSLSDFYCRVHPAPEEMELLLRAGAFDGFGRSRPAQFWDIQLLVQRWGDTETAGQGWLLPPAGAADLPPTTLSEPTRLQRLQWELELLGFPASGHPLELYPNIAWSTYCPVNRLGEFVGQQITLCGLVIEDRVHHQVTGEPMKFLTLADWTGIVETELFAQTYKSYGLATVRYPVLEITARVEPFENGRGCTLRALRAGRPRTTGGALPPPPPH
jgi:DNA-directed DNA polymerase III PolC